MDNIQTNGKNQIKDSMRRVLLFGLMLLVGINLRTVLLAVPPILPLLSHDLHLSYTETGLLTSLPTLVMGAVSLPAGILIGRVGGRIMVAVGFVLLALGASLRALWPTLLPLYFFTALLSLGITFSQTAIPSLIRQWFSSRIGFVTALYSDGLVAGETLGAVLTIPVLGWLGQNTWTGSFVFWSVPVVLTLILWLWLTPASMVGKRKHPDNTAESAPAQVAQRPTRLNPLTLGLLIGCAQLIYFGINAWTPSYNQAIQASAITPLALGMLNAAQLPAALAITFFADRLVGKRVPFMIAGIFCLIALAGWVWTPAILEPLWAALLGGTSILVYTLGMALPPLLAKQERVGQWTGTTLTVGYLLSFVGPFSGGWFWDRTHVPAIAFLPLAIAAGIIIVLGTLLPLTRQAHRNERSARQNE